jgi:tungstate transport system ATP-binding protein
MNTVHPVYRLKGLVKQYDGSPVVSVHNIDIGENQIVAVLGPNGSGKTTLLNMLAFLDAPSSGEIQFEGHRLNWAETNLHLLRRRVTLVTRPPTMFNASVLGNVTYGLRLRNVGRSERYARARRALEKVGLQGFEHRPARKLSSGESQRVALARALVLKPRVLLLDEPTSAIQSDSVPQIEVLLLDLVSDNGTTIVFSTLDPVQAERIAHRVIDLRDGKVEHDRTVQRA